MREPWEAHARAAESGAPDTSGSRPGPSIDEYPLSSPYLEGAPWAENGPEKEHESRTGLRPGGFRRRYPPALGPAGERPVRFRLPGPREGPGYASPDVASGSEREEPGSAGDGIRRRIPPGHP